MSSGWKGSISEFGLSAKSAFFKYYPILITGVLLLLMAKTFAILHDSIFGELFRDLGISLVVAFVIILSIEQRSRAEQREAIGNFLELSAEKIHEIILGVEFLPGMYDFAKQHLMRAPFFRTGTSVHYSLRYPKLNGCQKYGADILIMDIKFIYTVKNMMHEEMVFPLRFELEEIRDGLDAALESELNKLRLRVGAKNYSDKELEAGDLMAEDTPGRTCYLFEIKLMPSESKDVEINYSTLKLIADTEVFRSIYPCDSVDIYISNPSGISVDINAIHPEKIDIPNKTPTGIVGRIGKPLFPNNGILVWWHPTGA